MLGDTPTTLVNRAIQQIGANQPPVTGTLPNFDNTPAGVAALSPGDRIECGVDGIGTLKVTIGKPA